MHIQLLRTKIQQLIVSESSENYPESIALPDELIQAAGLRLFEQVFVHNLTIMVSNANIHFTWSTTFKMYS